MRNKIEIYPPIKIPLFTESFSNDGDIIFYGEYDKKLYMYVNELSKFYDEVVIKEGGRIWHETVINNLPQNVKIACENPDFPVITEAIGEGKNMWDINIVFPLSLYWNRLKDICPYYENFNFYQRYRLSSLLYLIDSGGVKLIYPFLWLNDYALDCFVKIVNKY